MENLVNKGVIVLNEAYDDNLLKSKTFIVIGEARSGTSMVAGALHNLAVNMILNPPDNDIVFERRDLSKAVEESRISDMEDIIANLNSTFNLWGWKRPTSILHKEKWLGKFKNPHYIFVFRDLLAIANRNRISMLHDVVENMITTHKHYGLILDLLSKTDDPVMLVSYEKAIIDKEYFLRQLINFIGINPDSACIEKALSFISPGNYRYLDKSRITKTLGYL